MICGKQFKNSEALVSHIASEHVGKIDREAIDYLISINALDEDQIRLAEADLKKFGYVRLKTIYQVSRV